MDATTRDEVCVVVPMFNESTVIAEVVGELRSVFPLVVCVDDGSSDDSWERARTAGAVVVRHALNSGQGAAIQTGLEYAVRQPGVRHVITFDADGQHRLDDAVAMLDVARSGSWDVVFGSRFLSVVAQSMPRSRRALLKASVAFTRLSTGLRLTDSHVGLRVLSRHAAETISLTLNGMAHASEIHAQVSRRGLSYCEVPVAVEYTEYSLNKGQRNINAFNIALDLVGLRLRGVAGARRA